MQCTTGLLNSSVQGMQLATLKKLMAVSPLPHSNGINRVKQTFVMKSNEATGVWYNPRRGEMRND
jgi:hypothetical protein